MPTYPYTCLNCEYSWEEDQKITDEPIKICIKCEQPKAKRLISNGTGFILAGQGWFKDGYSNKK